MKQAQKIIGQRMMLIAADPEKHAAFILGLRLQERKSRYLSGQAPSVAEQMTWMQAREKLTDDAYFIICELDKPEIPLGTIRLHDAIHEKNSIRVSSWVMIDGVAPKKTLEALALAIDYVERCGYSCGHFEVHKNNLSTIRNHLRVGSEVVEENEHTVVFGATSRGFLEKMTTVYRMAEPHIQHIDP